MTESHLTDDDGRVWVLGEVLERGIWSRQREVRDADGRLAILEEPLTETDFEAHEADGEQLAQICAACADEQALLLADPPEEDLPPLLATVTRPEGGGTGIVIPRHAATLWSRLHEGATLQETLGIVHHIAHRLANSGQRPHGNLHPRNVLLDTDDSVLLTGWSTEPLAEGRGPLIRAAMAGPWFPPEVTSSTNVLRPAPGWDTWALAQALHASAFASPSAPQSTPRVSPRGLDKDALEELREAIATRLAESGSNPRFRDRVADKLGALVSRALSPQREPSPPYRFTDYNSFSSRISEIEALINPAILDVGEVLWPAHSATSTIEPTSVPLPKASFRGGEVVELTVTVSCTEGVTDHEDLICGLQLLDRDAPPGEGRVALEEAQFAVQVHPSGRFRYKLGIPGLGPGRYQIRVAFAVKGSGKQPQAVEANLEVQPPPGYVPPPREPTPTPIPFPVGADAMEDDDDELTDDPLTDENEELRPFPTPPPPAESTSPDEAGPLYEYRALEVPPPLTPSEVRPVALRHPDDPPEEELGVDDPMGPDTGTDLPSWRPRGGAAQRGVLSRVADALKRDTYLAVGSAIASSLLLVLMLSMLTRAC
ncbi:MAG: hypothetical protein KTR31_38265 [Myxococcales bacterium]|nr:hypothetical protein [Myxococcales bacterium]